MMLDDPDKSLDDTATVWLQAGKPKNQHPVAHRETISRFTPAATTSISVNVASAAALDGDTDRMERQRQQQQQQQQPRRRPSNIGHSRQHTMQCTLAT